MKNSILLVFLLSSLLSGCVTQKALPEKTPQPTLTPSQEAEISSEVEEAIGIPEQATVLPKTTPSEISVPDFEVNVTIDLGSVI